jgi:Two component regulator propeller
LLKAAWLSPIGLVKTLILSTLLFGASAAAQSAHAAADLNQQAYSLLPSLGLTNRTIFHFDFERNEQGGIRYVWLAVSDGLYRYDGFSATRFGIKDGLPSDFVRCVLVANDGKLWVGTDKGAGVFDGKSFHSMGTAKTLAGPNVHRILQDRQGTIWFTSDSWPQSGTSGGLTSLSAGKWKAWHVADGLPSDYVVDQFTDSQGRIFALTIGGPARLTGNRWVAEPFGPLPAGSHWGSAIMTETRQTGVVLSNGFSVWVLKGANSWSKLGSPPLHPHGMTATADGRLFIAANTRPNTRAFWEWTGSQWQRASGDFPVSQGWGMHLAEAPDGSLWYGGIDTLARWPRGGADWTSIPGNGDRYFLDPKNSS